MNIQLSISGLKKVGAVLFVLAGLLSLGTSVHYIQYRRMVDPFLAVVNFDVNSRASEIQAKYKAAQEAQAAQQQAPAAPTTTLPPTK